MPIALATHKSCYNPSIAQTLTVLDWIIAPFIEMLLSVEYLSYNHSNNPGDPFTGGENRLREVTPLPSDTARMESKFVWVPEHDFKCYTIIIINLPTYSYTHPPNSFQAFPVSQMLGQELGIEQWASRCLSDSCPQCILMIAHTAPSQLWPGLQRRSQGALWVCDRVT